MTIDLPLLRLLQLSSATLSTGSFAYSEGLEWAVEAGCVTDSHSTAEWLEGELATTMTYVDVPLLARLYEADADTLGHWDAIVFACRETAELRSEEHHRGQSMLRVLRALLQKYLTENSHPFTSFRAGSEQSEGSRSEDLLFPQKKQILRPEFILEQSEGASE